MKTLSDTERKTLDLIDNNPGITAAGLAQKLGGTSEKAVSGTTSRLTKARRCNRLKVQKRFVYYGRDHKLPEGVASWANKIESRHFTNGNGGKVAPALGGGVLMLLEVGDNGTMTVSVMQARKLYDDLSAWFGAKS